MAERVNVTFAAVAVSDLVEIRTYYTGQGVPEVGERLLREILNHAASLSVHPDKGRIVPEFDRQFTGMPRRAGRSRTRKVSALWVQA